MRKKEKTNEERVNNALENTEIPNIYFNGVVCTLSLGDFLLVLEKNGKPVVTLNASYTIIKSFANLLTQHIETLEKESGKRIMTTQEIEIYVKEKRGSKK